MKNKLNKRRVNKVKRNKTADAIIAVFLSILIISMVPAVSALQPRITEKGVEQNPAINSISNLMSKIILFFDIIPLASAQEFGCCENLINGATCLVTFSDLCVSGFFHENEICESICEIGCCITSTGCKQNTPKKQCVGEASFVENDPGCAIALCQNGCCKVNRERIWTTNHTCNSEYHGFWDSGYSDELSCLLSSYADVKGCCRSFTGCDYITRDECLLKYGTFFDKKCYDPGVVGCSCVLSPSIDEHYGCIEGLPDIYKGDSCGNVYSDEPTDECKGIDTWCDPAQTPVECKSMICEDVYANPDLGEGVKLPENYFKNFAPRNRTGKDGTAKLDKNHGESWCVYDIPTDGLGFSGMASVGSRHWRRYCLYGKEYMEPCADYRQNICLEDKEDIEGDEFTYASCIANGWRECVGVYDADECNANPFCFWWTEFGEQHEKLGIGSIDYEGHDKSLKGIIDTYVNKSKWRVFEREKVYEGESKRQDGDPQLCLPKVPPGYNELNSEAACTGFGSSFCTYEEAWWGADTENKECREDAWRVLSAHLCRSVGDCGTWFNWIGNSTTGFRIIELEEGDVDRVKKVIATPEAYAEFVNILKDVNKGRGTRGAFWSGNLLQYGLAYYSVAIGVIAIFYGVGTIGASTTIIEFIPVSLSTIPSIIVKETTTVIVTASTVITAAAVVAAGVSLIIWSFWVQPGLKQQTMQSVGAGLIAGATVALISSGPAGIIGLVVAGAIFGLYALGHSEEFYYQECGPSKAPVGGDDCHFCNEDSERPCSEYRCGALGTACVFNNTVKIGSKTFKVEPGVCSAVSNDGLPPKIKEIIITEPSGYKADFVSGLGPPYAAPAKIKITKDNSNSDCVDNWQIINIKLKLDEQALCRWDTLSTNSFVNMTFPFGSISTLEEEQVQSFSVPYFEDQSDFNVFARCADIHGNVNNAEYRFVFDVCEGRDETAPFISGTNRDLNNKFAFGISELPLTIYVNENSFCRWSKEDISYELMDSSTQCQAILKPFGFECSTSLNVISEIANLFYLRCNDTAGNVMQGSYELQLQGTEALLITSVKPESGTTIAGCLGDIETIIKLEVETAEGADDGIAACYWGNASDEISNIFDLTGANSIHSSDVPVSEISSSGKIYIACLDSALNIAKTNITMNIIEDITSPDIIRMYKESGNLVIKLNEKSVCAFNRIKQDYDFDIYDWFSAVKFSTSDGIYHRTSWRPDTWYINCKDECNNTASLTIYPQELA